MVLYSLLLLFNIVFSVYIVFGTMVVQQGDNKEVVDTIEIAGAPGEEDLKLKYSLFLLFISDRVGSRPTRTLVGSRPTRTLVGSRPTRTLVGSRSPPSSAVVGSRPTRTLVGMNPFVAPQLCVGS